jgi:hypothetical protein
VGQVRIAVAAASLNFPDLLLTRGEYQTGRHPSRGMGACERRCRRNGARRSRSRQGARRTRDRGLIVAGQTGAHRDE